MNIQRIARYSAAMLAAVLLSACGSMTSITSQVTSYGEWPADRKAGTFAFERLPSSKTSPEQAAQMEDAARSALVAAGFTENSDPKAADVSVLVGARLAAQLPAPWDDPFWMSGYGRWGYWNHGPYFRPGWPHYSRYGYYPYYAEPTRYEREIAILMRDRASGTPVYEARANSDGYSSGSSAIWRGMFDAAMRDFPATNNKPHSVTVPITP